MLDDFIMYGPNSYLQNIEVMSDRWPLLEARKAILRIRRSWCHLCHLIISHPTFEAFIILVIIANTVCLALEDPTKNE
jgi:hypothetical protein